MIGIGADRRGLCSRIFAFFHFNLWVSKLGLSADSLHRLCISYMYTVSIKNFDSCYPKWSRMREKVGQVLYMTRRIQDYILASPPQAWTSNYELEAATETV